jgi:hypothetical protein
VAVFSFVVLGLPAMRRPLHSWLFALALLFGQYAAQSHALAHIDPAYAGHPVEHCVAFHALDSALTESIAAVEPLRLAPAAPVHIELPAARPARMRVEPRGPPSFS